MALTKEDIVKTLPDEAGYPRNQSVHLVESLLELIKSGLASGGDVLISGFGKFCVKTKRERKGRNPVTGEGLMMEARRVLTFECSGHQTNNRQHG
jgi:integration host factor subunit alpha